MQNPFLIKRPHITEKATSLNEKGKYVFVVDASATKNEVKKSVKEIYRVDPVSVNIVNLPEKPKRYRGIKSYKAGYKKAIVSLREGQKIDLAR